MKRHLLFLFCFFLSLTAARATVYYVDGARTHNTGNGLSWQFAKKDIQAAINVAAAGDEIWVKAGTYLPTLDPNGGTSQRNKTFYLTSKDLRLYGGFSGNETLLSQRAPATNLTTLSGDLDPLQFPFGGTDDAYHVVVTNGRTSACVVDGFTISGGRADGGSVFVGLNQNRGGGMYNNSSSPTVTNCIFTANSANLWGGGMFNANNSSPAVSNCVFSANVGSGMANYQSSPAVSSCTFSNNTATNGGGGGMYNDVSTPSVSNCTFSANTTSTYGGGMYNYQSNTTVTNCTFSSNTASYSGGGMANQGSNPTVSGCVFTANAATDVNTYGEGGGMYNFSYSNPTVGNCAFSANTAGNFGGGLANYSSDATITSCVFSVNTARYGGGGISSRSLGNIQTTITISSSTFSANTATDASGVGGGIVLGAYNGGTITNSIFFGNTTPNNANWANRRNIFKSGPNKSLTVSYTLIGDYSAAATNEYTASNILTSDPLFVDTTAPAGGDGVWRTADDGLRIGCTSPARNAGTGTTPATDISENPRVGALDLGAYEYQGTGCPTLIYVDGSRPNNSGSGASWASAKKDIQVAINEVAAGGEIWVKAGTYLPTLDPNGGTSQRDRTFYFAAKDVKLYGGFSGNETLLSQRNPTTNVTTLSGDLDGAGGTNDAYHVLLTIACTSACIVDGFTITGGRANGATTFTVSFFNASIDQSKGGGMYNEFSSKPTVSNCVFSANTAQDGGGVYNISVSDIVMNSCTFSANTASNNGGGMLNTNGSSPVLNACAFWANSAANNGGGMFNTNSSSPTFNSVVFAANSASKGGGMYSENGGSPVVRSATFSANTASSQGGGLYYATSGGGSITNAVLYGNTGGPANRQNIYKDGTSTALSVSYALIGDYSAAATNNYTSGAGIIGGNPLFVNSGNPAGADGVFRTADDGLAVRCVSPVRNVGTGTTPATDIVGSNRFGTIDLGAYEYQGTGCPTRMYVDAGKADNAGVGTSWATAKKDVQMALTDLVAGGEIWAKAGTYLPTEDPNGNASPTDPRDKAFYITTKDVKLYGGFSGNETLLSQRNPATNVTILSGDLGGPSDTNDAYHVLVTIGRSNACVVDGFTISGGRANGNSSLSVAAASTSIYRFLGAGMCNKGSSPSVNACVFSSNTTSDFGGGMSNTDNSHPIISSSTFSGNTAGYDGGGMYNSYGSSPAVSFCTFSSNTAGYNGGGMSNYKISNPILNTCTFSANTAKSGGGLYNSYSSSPTLNACTFSTNNATLYGGGIYNRDSDPNLNTCTFSVNSATLYGGGMYNTDTSYPVVRACIFSGNTSNNNGGGMYNEDGSRPVVKACTFSSNSAINYGGGMYNKYVSAFVVDSCIFLTNSAKQGGGIYNDYSGVAVRACAFSANMAVDGGGIYNNVCNLLVETCVFSANTASSNGGGMYVDYSNLPVNSCTFTGNTAGNRGGGLYYAYFPINGGNTITNCILTNNTGGYVNQQNIHNNSSRSGLTVSYSVVGDYSTTVSNNQYTSGAGIIAADPLFANASSPVGADGLFRTADDGLRLQSCSPALNAGTGTTPTADISGNNRVGAIDLGAYEYQGSPSATLAASITTDTRSPQGGSAVTFGNCGALIATLAPSGVAPVSGSITAQVYVQSTAPSINQTSYVRRHYDISPATNPDNTTAQITLYFTQADFDDYNTARGSLPPLPIDATDAANNKANLRITQEHGTSATGLPGSYSGWSGAGPAKVLITPTSVRWNTPFSRWEVVFPVNGFSGFFATSAISTPLPLELLHFSARRVGENANQLDWATGEEEEATSFVVERSGNARDFIAIGVISGKGVGSTYRFDDHTPLAGDNYYRLMIREAGKSSYSKTVLVKGSGTVPGEVQLSPNPATDRVKIVCTDKTLEGSKASVWSAEGRFMATFVLAEETVLDVSEWTTGVYLLRLANGSTLRLIKQ